MKNKKPTRCRALACSLDTTPT